MNKSCKQELKSKLNNGLRTIILLSILFVSFEQFSFAQTSLLNKQIKLKTNQATVDNLLKEISKSGGFSFSYSNNIDVSKTVFLSNKNGTVRKLLDEIFPKGKVKYIEKSNKIILVPQRHSSQTPHPKQKIIGRVIDKDTKAPLVGVNIVVSSESPLKGTSTNDIGFFRIDNVPIGKHHIVLKYIGYKDKVLHDVLLVSGKVLNLDIELEPSFYNINEVIVKPGPEPTRPVNDLAFTSARSFNSEEVNYYPGSLNDISRAAVSFPGVLSNNDGQNHIIIRGNSPKGLQWRIEGIEIPNLNHFAEIGSSGGGVNMLSNNMFSSSDFFTGAFPAEYGNALSGVFDLHMRTGNNVKHERTFQIGFIGTELMLEGPLKRESNATYIAHYRYTTLRLAQKLGAPIKNIPVFQDVSFKFYLPTKKYGIFSIFGIGGISNEVIENDYDWGSNMGVLGLSNTYFLGDKTYIKSIVTFSGWQYLWDSERNIGSIENPVDYKVHNDVLEYGTKVSLSLNKSFNVRHKVKLGIIYDYTEYSSFIGWRSDTLYNIAINPTHPSYSENIVYDQAYSDDNGNASTLQSFINWKYRITDKLSLNTGLHFMQLYLNNNYSIEPRAGLQWNFLPRHSLSAAFGIHSRKESLSLYTGTKTLYDGAKIHPNTDLDLSKAQHYVMGYNYVITENLRAKIEAYYQNLYDIPIYPFPPYFSTINFDFGFEGNILVNKGTGYNKGVELLIEKFIANGYYLMLNGNLYDSKYQNHLGQEYDTKYNGQFSANVVFRKEFKVGRNKQNWLGLSTRLIYMGGLRYLPINLEQSIAQNNTVRIYDNGYTEKADDYFRLDLQVIFRRNKPKYTSEWRLDIINVTNRENMRYQYYENMSIVTEYQNPIIPILAYRIQF